ncbi:MAG TPA: hypothetical protein VJ904_07030, partial [Tichowtungia sp.]|nr:hypothetical protein [Tichowtungia sp.]
YISAANRRGAIVGGSVSAVAAGANAQSAAIVRSLQSWVESNYQYFCRINTANPNKPTTSHSSSTHAGLKYNAAECGSTNAAKTSFSTDADLNVSTTASSWWTRKAPGVDSFGACQAGDYIGDWIWADLKKAFQALRMYRTETPEWVAPTSAELGFTDPSAGDPPLPPGTIYAAKGYGSDGPNVVNLDYARSDARADYAAAGWTIEFETSAKVGNFCYERCKTYETVFGWKDDYDAYVYTLFKTLELETSLAYSNPLALLFFIKAECLRSIGQDLESGATLGGSALFEATTSNAYVPPPESANGYSQIISLQNGWNAIYNRDLSSIASAATYRANISRAYPTTSRMNFYNFPAFPNYTSGTYDYMRGWHADLAECYYLLDEY